MDRWNAPQTIFAPVIAGVPADVQWSGFGNALLAAADMIPTTTLPYTVKRPGSFKKTTEVRQRRTVAVTGEDAKPYGAQIRLLDRSPDLKYQGPDEGLWEVSLTNWRDGLCAPAIPADFDTAILEVSLLRIYAGRQPGAPQLALLRYLYAEALATLFPEVIIFGGQRHWDQAWWTDAIREEPPK